MELKTIAYTDNDTLQINNHTNIQFEENIREVIYYISIITYIPDYLILPEPAEFNDESQK